MAAFMMTARYRNESTPSGTLVAFGAAGESSSLYVLDAVTDTVDSICSLEKLALAMHQQAVALLRTVDKAPKVLDPDDVVIDALERVYTNLDDKLVPFLHQKRESIDRDHALTEDHRSLLHCAYSGFLSALESWTESSKALRAAIIHHDLAVEVGNEPIFDSPEALFESINNSVRN